jgi:hypothetical protein
MRITSNICSAFAEEGAMIENSKIARKSLV